MESERSFGELVERALLETSSFKELHRRIYYFQVYMGNSCYADDATQDVLITVLTRYKTEVRNISSLEAWVLRIAHHEAIDYLRRTRPDLSLDEVDDPDESPLCESLAVTNVDDMPEEYLERQAFNQLVWEALDELPIKRRSCLVLRLYWGWETEQIARLHNLCEEQVRRHIRDGKQQFRDAYTRLVSEQQKKERG